MRGDVELFLDAYTGEFVEFVAAVREGRPPAVTGEDARRALAIALACIESVRTNAPVGDRRGGPVSFTLAVSAEMVFLDLPLVERVRRIHDAGFAVEIWDWTKHDLAELAGDRRPLHVDDRLRLRRPDRPRRRRHPAGHRARVGRGVPRASAGPSLNLHGTGLDGRGLPVQPVEVVTGEMWLAAEGTLRRIAELGEREDVVFTLENLNLAVDHPGTPFARAADTHALVRAVDSPHLRMNLDLYHAQIGEGNLIELVRDLPAVRRRDPGRRRARPLRAGHRRDQLPRRRPGAARTLGYTGVVGLEAWASGDSEAPSRPSGRRSAEAFGPAASGSAPGSPADAA